MHLLGEHTLAYRIDGAVPWALAVFSSPAPTNADAEEKHPYHRPTLSRASRIVLVVQTLFVLIDVNC